MGSCASSKTADDRDEKHKIKTINNNKSNSQTKFTNLNDNKNNKNDYLTNNNNSNNLTSSSVVTSDVLNEFFERLRSFMLIREVI